ncbi:MAG TPA: YIP1 family protein [Vicinamibacterales bacterium]|nr:YIP1 family protein [Vicinamibacterales bacterium]
MTTFPHRLMGASVLDVDTYEEVEADRGATWQALLVVLASSLAGGIGATGFTGTGEPPVGGIFFWSAVSLLAWAAWALLVFEIGGRLLPEPETRVDVGELLRTIGFSSAPGMLRVFGVVPELTVPVFALTTLWMLVAMIVAVRQALDYRSTARAVWVCTLGLAFAVIIALVFGIFLGPSVSVLVLRS